MLIPPDGGRINITRTVGSTNHQDSIPLRTGQTIKGGEKFILQFSRTFIFPPITRTEDGVDLVCKFKQVMLLKDHNKEQDTNTNEDDGWSLFSGHVKELFHGFFTLTHPLGRYCSRRDIEQGPLGFGSQGFDQQCFAVP